MGNVALKWGNAIEEECQRLMLGLGRARRHDQSCYHQWQNGRRAPTDPM